MVPKLTLNSDFKEFIESLNANGVEYLVVGGHAVALHGYPQFTKDLDIWLKRDRANAERVVQAIADFGFSSLGLTPEDFLTPDQFIQMGYPPLRIDLATDLSGIRFDECYPSRVEADIDGV